MIREVITLNSDDDLELAARLFEKHDFNGFPVVDQDRKLVGLVTAYEMILQSSQVHLPFVFELINKKGAVDDELRKHFDGLRQIKIKEVMNVDPLVVEPEVKVIDLAKEFLQHHRVNPIPVVDGEHRLLGVVSRYDIIRFFNERFLMQALSDADHSGILRRLTRLGEEPV